MSGQSWGAQAPQGPGWWQASDGLWYPPQGEAAPAQPAAPVAAPAQPVAPAAPAAPVQPAFQPPPQAAQPVQPAFPQPVQPAFPQAAPPVPPAFQQPAPVFQATVQSLQTHPVHVSFSGPLEVSNRWRPLYAWLLVIPHILRAIVPLIVGLIHQYVAIFSAIFSGKVSQSSHDAVVKMWKVQWQLMSFSLCWRETPPTFDDTDPAMLTAVYTGQSVERFGFILKFFKAFGKVITVLIAMIVAYVHMIIGIIGVLAKSSWPQGSRDKIVDAMRQATELSYYFLLSDVPPRD